MTIQLLADQLMGFAQNPLDRGNCPPFIPEEARSEIETMRVRALEGASRILELFEGQDDNPKEICGIIMMAFRALAMSMRLSEDEIKEVSFIMTLILHQETVRSEAAKRGEK